MLLTVGKFQDFLVRIASELTEAQKRHDFFLDIFYNWFSKNRGGGIPHRYAHVEDHVDFFI